MKKLKEDNGVASFLKSMNFIAPSGFKIDYFVLPTNDQNEIDQIVPPGIEYEAQQSPFNATSTVFLKKSLDDLQSRSLETQTIVSVPSAYPKTDAENTDFANNQNIIENGGAVVAGDRAIKPLVESLQRKTIILMEDVGRFPKNTIFSLIKG